MPIPACLWATEEIYLSYGHDDDDDDNGGDSGSDDADVLQLKPRQMMTRRTVHGSAELPAANVQ